MAFEHPPLLPDDAPFDDPDNPEWTEADFARAQGPETLPLEVLRAFPKTYARLEAEGRLPPPSSQVTLALDPDVLAYYRLGGPDWQARINTVLRQAIGRG